MNIMCEADLTILTYNWIEGRSDPMPYFETIHTCKNWDRVMDWMQEADASHKIHLRKPDGQKVLPGRA